MFLEAYAAETSFQQKELREKLLTFAEQFHRIN